MICWLSDLEYEGDIYMDDLLKLKLLLSGEGILISFNGSLTNGIIEEMGNAIKRYLEDGQKGRGAITDIFAVYIEQTQNVRNYVRKNDLDETHGSSIVVISISNGNYQISSGNSIRKTDIPELSSRLVTLASLDKDGLKKLYKEQMKKERKPDAMGAGLGMIEIARRVTGNIAYSFQPLDDEFDFFSISVTVKGGE